MYVCVSNGSVLIQPLEVGTILRLETFIVKFTCSVVAVIVVVTVSNGEH